MTYSRLEALANPTFLHRRYRVNQDGRDALLCASRVSHRTTRQGLDLLSLAGGQKLMTEGRALVQELSLGS